MTRFLTIVLACWLASTEAFSPLFQKSAVRLSHDKASLAPQHSGVQIAKRTRDVSRPVVEGVSMDVIFPCFLVMAAAAATVVKADENDDVVKTTSSPKTLPSITTSASNGTPEATVTASPSTPVAVPAAVTVPVVNVPVINAPVVNVPVAKVQVSKIPDAKVQVSKIPVAQVQVSKIPVAKVQVSKIPVAKVQVSKIVDKKVQVSKIIDKKVQVSKIIDQPTTPVVPVSRIISTGKDISKLKMEIASTKEGEKAKEARLEASMKEEQQVLPVTEEKIVEVVTIVKRSLLAKFLRILKKIIAPWRKWSNIQ